MEKQKEERKRMKEEREQRKEDRKQVEKHENQQRSRINKAFEKIPRFDGTNPNYCFNWLEQTEHSGQEGSVATGSLGGTSHTSATSTLPELTRNPISADMHPLAKMTGLGVTFDSSATKPASTDSQDTDVHGRQHTRGRNDGSWPASHPRGGRERSSVRKTNQLMPHQEGGCPAGAPRNIPPSSTTGAKRASTDPLENIANYRSVGWKKDLSHILRGFYLYNYPSHMEAELDKLKTKFLNHLGQCQEEWKTIKEETPLEYIPYMEHQFLALTGVKLKGLSQFTGWIKPGSYYHGVVARKGQLHLPQIHPSETQALMQKKVDTPTTSYPTMGGGGSMTQGAHSNPPIPMETGGGGMASPGWSRLRQLILHLRKNG